MVHSAAHPSVFVGLSKFLANITLGAMSLMADRFFLRAVQHKAQQDATSGQELCEFVERALKDEIKRRVAAIEKDFVTISDKQKRALLVECYAEDVFEVERDFPRIQRQALFVSTMGVVEANIVSICRAASRILRISEDFKDRGPCVIARGITFLEEKARIDTSKYQSDIRLAENLVAVRNCIAHSAGDIKSRKPDEAKKIRRFVSRVQTIDIDRHDHLIIHRGFVESSSERMQILVDRLFDSVGKRLKVQPS
jgi:hypothetical protein